MKPIPLVMFSWKRLIKAIERDAPAIPAINPPMLTVRYLIRVMLTPRVSAAWGFWPAARIFSPNVVLLRTKFAMGTSR